MEGDVRLIYPINGEAVMQQVLQGAAPSYWYVFPAKPSQFLKNIAVYSVCTLLLLGFLLYLKVHPAFVIGLGDAAKMPELHDLWRTIDFGAAAIVIPMLLVFLLSEVRNLSTARKQALVLLPEGFIMQKGSSRKTMTVIHYGTITELTTSVSNYTWYLVMPRADGNGIIKLGLDGRFGPSSEIAAILQQAHEQYAGARFNY